MEKLVLPAIGPEDAKLRARDELPQSAAGRTIMTTEPKFIPEAAVPLALEGGEVQHPAHRLRGLHGGGGHGPRGE